MDAARLVIGPSALVMEPLVLVIGPSGLMRGTYGSGEFFF